MATINCLWYYYVKNYNSKLAESCFCALIFEVSYQPSNQQSEWQIENDTHRHTVDGGNEKKREKEH